MFQEEERFGVAHALEKPAMEFLPDEGTVENWKPLLMELRGGDFPDYLSSNLGCRMCSERLRKILQEHRSPLDLLQWLDVVVKDKREDRNYFILHFPQPPDVLNKEKTIFAGHFVVKAVLSVHRVDDHRVFAYPHCGELPLFISEQVKQAIEQKQCTGMEITIASIA